MKRLWLLLAFAMTLTACDAIAKLGGPTHRFVLQADIERAAEVAEEGESAEQLVERSMDVVGERLDALGIVVHETRFLGDGRVVIETSGDESSGAVFAAATRTADLSFRLVDDAVLPSNLEAGIGPPGTQVLPMRDGYAPIAVKRFGGMSGDRVEAASAMIDSFTGEPVVTIRFDALGGQQFAQMSRDNLDRRIAVMVDGEVITAPVIQEPILGGQVQIAGGFDGEEAAQLAALLQSGALPLSFEVLEERAITE